MPRKLNFFHKATLEICSSLDKDKMLVRCQKFLKTYFPVDQITMGYLDFRNREFHHVAQTVDKDTIPTRNQIQMSRPVAEYLKTHQESSDEVIVLNRPEDNRLIYQWVKSLGQEEGSIMSLPLSLDTDDIGYVGIFSRGWEQFSQDHVRLFSMLSVPFSIAMSNLLKHCELKRLKDMLKEDNRCLKEELKNRSGGEIIGAEGGLKKVVEKVQQVSHLSSQVLLLGETGVGKEIIANAIHYASQRSSGPFVKVNCGAIPDSLIDSELFGYEKGAFTGALERKRGKFERAHKGTLFLDEIGELTAQAQVRLLRVLQNREIERVGGSASIPVDVRIIVATHRDLERMVAEGSFREDLWFRLNVFPIHIPPLRERLGDIPELVRYFIRKKAEDMKIEHHPEPSARLVALMQEKEWKGNIRELENTIERLMIQYMGGGEQGGILRTDGLVSSATKLQYSLPQASSESGLSFDCLDTAIESHIRAVMAHTRGRVQGEDGAAAILGIHPSTLRSRMRKMGIPFGRTEYY